MRAIYVDKHIPRILLTKAITPIWKDFVWTPLSSAKAGSLPDQPLPGSRWIRVKNVACGICATDLSLLFMKTNPSVTPAALPGLSRLYLGHEAVSIITEEGPGVKRFKVGDRDVQRILIAIDNGVPRLRMLGNHFRRVGEALAPARD